MIGIQKKEKDKTLVEQAQKRLLQYISEQGLKMNSLLPKENELVNVLGVSRVVVREALSRLRALGFIETKRKKGTVLVMPKIFGVLKIIVSSGALDRNSMRDLYELRLMLELGMADFIFKGRTEENMNCLQKLVDQEEQTPTTEESISLDIQFHQMLYSMAGNKSLSDFQHLLAGVFSLYAPREKDWKVKQIITHAGLLEVLRCGTPDSFRSAMRLHLNTQFENSEKTLEKTEKKRKSTKISPSTV